MRQFLELIRFSHTVFALPFALLAAALAWRETPFRWQALAGIVLCMVFARSAAMAFNRLVDREIDAGNPRTAGRHLPAGLLSVAAVRAFTVLCCVGFVASTLLFWPNRWPPLRRLGHEWLMYSVWQRSLKAAFLQSDALLKGGARMGLHGADCRTTAMLRGGELLRACHLCLNRT